MTVKKKTPEMHCPECERRWTATGAAHCSGCHRHFSTTGLFAKHRVRFECVDPTSLHTQAGKPVMALSADGVWTGWTDPDLPRPEFWRLQ